MLKKILNHGIERYNYAIKCHHCEIKCLSYETQRHYEIILT